MLAFIGETFSEGWVTEVRFTFQHDPISLHIARAGRRVAGFSAYDVNNFRTGWFGPMGTHTDFRGKSIGRVLLKRSLRDIRDQGNARAVIPWAGPIDFYSDACGARISRVMWTFKKALDVNNA